MATSSVKNQLNMRVECVLYLEPHLEGYSSDTKSHVQATARVGRTAMGPQRKITLTKEIIFSISEEHHTRFTERLLGSMNRALEVECYTLPSKSKVPLQFHPTAALARLDSRSHCWEWGEKAWNKGASHVLKGKLCVETRGESLSACRTRKHSYAPKETQLLAERFRNGCTSLQRASQYLAKSTDSRTELAPLPFLLALSDELTNPRKDQRYFYMAVTNP
jgi:hypothetical protein